MRYWTDTAKVFYEQLFGNIASCNDGVVDYVKKRLKYAVETGSPEMVCAILLYCDTNVAESAKIRFSTAIRAMEKKRYDIAYACWDDEGRSFEYTDEDDPEFPDGAHSGRVLRDLCDSMMSLQHKLSEQVEQTIDNDLCGLLSRII